MDEIVAGIVSILWCDDFSNSKELFLFLHTGGCLTIFWLRVYNLKCFMQNMVQNYYN